jgi:hypothetical protein
MLHSDKPTPEKTQVRGKILFEIDGPKLRVLPIADNDLAVDAVLAEFCRLIRDGELLCSLES